VRRKNTRRGTQIKGNHIRIVSRLAHANGREPRACTNDTERMGAK
jgi:hypothetical protein